MTAEKNAMADHARNRLFFISSTLLMMAVAGYMAFSLFWLAPVPQKLRLPLTLLLFLFSQCITAMRVLVTWRTDLPFALVRVGGFLSSSFMVLSWLVLLRDAFHVLLLILSLFLPMAGKAFASCRSLMFTPDFQLGMLAAAFLLAAAGMYRTLKVPQVKETRIHSPALPEELDGLRIVLLSDLHIGSAFTGAWLKNVVERANGLSPDLILVTGDLADGTPERLSRELRPLASLNARGGVFFSVGNHEYYSGLEPWLLTYRSWGLSVLLNEHRLVRLRKQNIIVAAVTDPCADRFPGKETPDTSKALLNAPQGFRILMAHRPGNAVENAAMGCHLQLSGHTHGGQFFFLFPLVSYMNKGYRSGLYHVGNMPLYVSPGTGMWGYVPMRFGVAAEISLLILRKASTS